MPTLRPTLLLLPLLGALGGCTTEMVAGTPSVNLPTSALANPADSPPVRGTQAVPGRPARVYVMVSLDTDCNSTRAPDIEVEKPPAKGAVSFHPRQETTIQFSKSGNCIGRRVLGTGIYYTARPGEKGPDTFTIRARSGDGEPSSQTFNIAIAEPD